MHGENEVVLRLSLASLTRSGDQNDDTRAATPTIELNENKIESLDIFLYDINAGDNTLAAYATRVTGLDENQSFDLVFSVPSTVVDNLFRNGRTKCKIYVVANHDTGCTSATNGTYPNSSVTALKAQEIEANFDTTQTIDLTQFNNDSNTYRKIKNPAPQQLFVMDSEVVEVTKDGNKLTGTVQLSRAASKITFRTTIAKKVVINGKTWAPQINSLKFTYHNVVNKGYIDNGSKTSNSFAVPTGDDVYADMEGLQMSTIYSDSGVPAPDYGSSVEGVNDNDWVTIDHIVPIYTYGSHWTEGAENEAHITVTVPWAVEGDDESEVVLQEYSYFVPVNMKDYKMERNKHYRINLRVGVIGDIVVDEVEDTEFSYEVIDWVGEQINVGLQKPSYLVVEETYVELHNEIIASVMYHSSEPLVFYIKNGNTTKTSLSVNGTTGDYNYLVSSDINSKSIYKNYTLKIADGHITFEHNLDNTMGADNANDKCDYLPTTTVVRVYLENNTNIYQEITFVQYPALSVNTYAGDKNNKNWLTVNGNNSNNSSSWTSGQNIGANCGGAVWMGIGGKNASGLNPDIYEISVSAFDLTTLDYIIADPRGPAQDITVFPAYNNNGISVRNADGNTVTTNNSSSPDKAVASDQRNATTIKGYRPTLTGENAKNLIAPKFIVASFMSTCTNADGYFFLENSAWYRCAGYQEAGYPAGRWRLPTAAELEFIGKLCSKGMLPEIFNNKQTYPSSSGNYRYLYDTSTKTGSFTYTTEHAPTSVRCVYDTWYWRDKVKNNTYNNKLLLWGADGNVADMKANGTYNTYLVPIE